MPAKTIYFSKARTALKYGIQSLDIDDQDIILVPDFVCDTIFEPINKNSLNFLVYELADDLSPKWPKLDSLVTKNTKAIIMVHYFGQPQDIKKFLNFCERHNLYLIEDNAHGHSGIFEGKELGTFGDIGISSPRKFESCGGILYLNRNFNKEYIVPELDYEKIDDKYSIFRFLLNKAPKLKRLLKQWIKKRPKYEDPRAFRESIMDDFFINEESVQSIALADWSNVKDLRQRRFVDLKKIALEGGLMPVFSEMHIGSNPWCFAAYARNQKEAIKWFEWGWKNNIEVFSWPPLREQQIKEGDKAYERWKRLVCFSTAQ